MSLTNDDKTWIKNAIVEGVVDALGEVVTPQFDVVHRDITILKEDVQVLKEDVRVLKEDVQVLKEDVRVLKQDMREVKSTLADLGGRVETLEADVKEIYYMLADVQKGTAPDKAFAKLSLEEKILKAYADVLATAKEAGVKLPS